MQNLQFPVGHYPSLALQSERTAGAIHQTLVEQNARLSNRERPRGEFCAADVSHLYLAGPSVMVLPVREDSRAASRISVTMTLFSREDRPAGFSLRRTTAMRYEMESASCGASAAGVGVSSVLAFPRRTRRLFPPV